jgi:nucleotide-binding universal stress UspA family protein
MALGGTVAIPPLPEEWGRKALEKKLCLLLPADPAVHVEHRLKEGAPATEILRTARALECDLIVMGTHGRTGVGRLLMGSVAEEVLRKAPCPVLTVKTAIPGEVLAEKPVAEVAGHPGAPPATVTTR